MATTAVLLLFLSPIFGGTVTAHLTFDSPAECRLLLTQVRKHQVRHEVVQDCQPAVELPERKR